MGYCIIGVAVDGEENGFKLSGDISKLRALVNNDRMGAGITYPFNKSRTLHGRVLNSVGDISSAHFSFSLDDKSASIAYTIKSIDNNDVVWFNEKLANDVQIYKDKDEEWFIQNWLHDDNALYVAGFPEIGNMIIENLSGLANVAKLNPMHALILIVISMTLTIIGGAIPATMASKKDPVDALRTE